MLNVNVIQAEYGDCFLIELGDNLSNPHQILIDGGPSAVYRAHLRPTLDEICKEKILDLVICTHIDIDHIGGLLALFLELNSSSTGNTNKKIKVKNLWHNSFQELLDVSAKDVGKPREFFANVALTRYNGLEKTENLSIMQAVGEGIELGELARQLSIQVNYKCKGGLVVSDEQSSPIEIDDATLHVLGPSQKNVERLRSFWNKWVAEHSRKPGSLEISEELVALDSSISNLSSIMFLIESEGKKAIFTGDGSGDDVIEALCLKGLIGTGGKIHVNLLKVPHHGSERNVSKDFFDRVTAETYVLSANGRDDNPSLSTLKWIIESAHVKRSKIEIVATNVTRNIEKVRKDYPEQDFNYTIRFLKEEDNYMKLRLK